MLPAGDSRSPRLHGAVFARPSHPQAALHVFLTVFGQEDHLGAGRSDIMSEQNRELNGVQSPKLSLASLKKKHMSKGDLMGFERFCYSF